MEVIKAASEGDVVAINKILKHYEGYIVTLSTRRFYDESGCVQYCVDETLRRRLETKLITKFNIYPAGHMKQRSCIANTPRLSAL